MFSLEEIVDLVCQWTYEGKFTYKGISYLWGVNQYSAGDILTSLVKVRITDLATHFDDLMCLPGLGSKRIVEEAKGFTIGNGKRLHWHIIPQPCGTYKCFPQNEDSTLGYPRAIEPTTIVNVQYRY